MLIAMNREVIYCTVVYVYYRLDLSQRIANSIWWLSKRLTYCICLSEGKHFEKSLGL